MPQQFTGTVESPTDLQFGADEFVDASNSLEGLSEGARALADLSGHFIRKNLQEDLLAEEANAENRESELRRLKQEWYQAADRRDEEQVNNFGQQIEELIIAERQGAINGSNASIRKEALLRSYINRFPHREEELRQIYSAHRRALQESRATKPSDPFEEAYDDIIKEAVARGKTPIQVLEDRQKADANQRTLQDLQVKAALGADIAPEVEANFDTNVLPRLHDVMFGIIDEEYQAAVQGTRDVDVNNVKRKLEAVRNTAIHQTAQTLNALVAQSSEPGATLPLEVRKAQIAKINQMFDNMLPLVDNVDSLKAMGRNLEHLKHKVMGELMQVDPILRMLIAVGAVDWAGKLLAENYPQVATMAATMGPAGVRAFIDNAPTPLERNRRIFQARAMGIDYSPEERAEDLRGVLMNGTPPAQTGDPVVDAGRLIQNTYPIIQSKHTPPEAKRNAGTAILEAEKRETTYLAPGAHWYKDKKLLSLLQGSPELAARMEEELVGATANVTRQMAELGDEVGSLTFAPQLEAESQNHSRPWKAYPNGGPFTLSLQRKPVKISPFSKETYTPKSTPNRANVDSQALAQLPIIGDLMSFSPSAQAHAIEDTLNNMYWLIRGMQGVQVAEQWAEQVLAQRDADLAVQEEARTAEEAEGSIPTIDFDLTD